MHMLHAMGEEAENIAYRLFENPSDIQGYRKVVKILSHHFKGEMNIAYKPRNIFPRAG